MIKKGLFKKITALALATCLAASPTFVYAADDAEAVFVEEQETVIQDETSSDEGYAEEVFTEDATEEENIEESATEEPVFVGEDVVVEENNEPEFVQEDSVVTEDSATEEVAAADEALGVDDVTMEMLVNGGDESVTDDIIDEDGADAVINYAAVSLNYDLVPGAAPLTLTQFVVDTGVLPQSGIKTISFGSSKTSTPDAKEAFTYSGNGASPTSNDTIGAKALFTAKSASLLMTVTYQDDSVYNVTLKADYSGASVSTNYYPTLTAAITAATAGSTVKLEKDAELASTIEISKNLIIDLNGKKISATGVRALLIDCGTVELKGTGEIYADAPLDSSVIRVGHPGDSSAAYATTKATLTIGSGVTVSSDTCYGVTVFGKNVSNTAVGQELILNGKINVTGGNEALSGNGNSYLSLANITINSGAEVKASNQYAIYNPQAGTTTINGGTISGTGGIEAKGGTIKISGSPTISASGTLTKGHNNNGASTSGYAFVAVYNSSYKGSANYEISGGTFNGPCGIVVDSLSDWNPTLKITGGTFSSSFEVECDKSVVNATGGTFNGNPAIIANSTTHPVGSGKITVPTAAVSAGNIEVADNHVWVTDSSKKTSTLYKFSEAFAKAHGDNATITLYNDVALGDADVATTAYKNTFDLNGYQITGSTTESFITLDTGADLTIKDSGSSGQMNNSTAGAITMTDGKLTISNGTIKGNTDAISATKGTLTITDGKFTGTTGAAVNLAGTNATLVADINGGKFYGACKLKVGHDSGNQLFKSITVESAAMDVTDSVAVNVGNAIWSTDGTDNKLHTTLQNAIDDAKAGSTITLTKDATGPLTIDKKLTLDLHGKTITSSGDYTIGIYAEGDLTVIDSLGGGFVTNTTGADVVGIKLLADNAKLTVGSNTSKEFTVTGKGSAILSDYLGTVTVNSGNVGNAQTAAETDAIKMTAGNLVINGGTLAAITNSLNIAPARNTNVTIDGGIFKDAVNVAGTPSYLKSISVADGQFAGAFTVSDAEKVNKFIEGGIYKNLPSPSLVADGYVAIANTDSKTKTDYPWMIEGNFNTFKLTMTYTSGGAANAPTCSEKDPSAIQEGKKVTVTADKANDGYKFDGWYEGTTKLGTSLTYTIASMTADHTLEARYLKALTITAPTENVPLGQDYKGTASLIKVTGLLSSDTESTMIDKSAAVITAASYKKDTAKVGDTFDTSVTGVKLTTAGAKKYYIDKTEAGKLTVIESATAEQFVKAVAALPTADKATAANRTAVDAAKKMYEGLSTAEKNQADVKAAKTKLDAVDTAVTNHEKADAADALIKALPEAKNATSADRENLDKALEAYNALTADQKKLVPDADREKLAQVEAAVKAAEKADEEAAAAVKKLIDALPSVADATAADRDALTEAQEAYAALTPAQKKLLPGAEATLEALDEVITAAENDKKAADAVTAKINALPDPEDATKEDREKVDAAKDALAALTPAQQKLVPDAAKQRLEAVDEAVKAKEEDTDQKAADAVMEKIEAIKKQPAGKGKVATEEARAAYDALTDAQKALLPKSAESLLTAAEEAYTKDRTFQCGDNWYKVLPSGNVSYNRPADSKCTSATVPNQIKQDGYMYKVVKVSIGAFKNCEKLEWVVINKNIQIIGEYAFKNTPSLYKVKVLTRQLKSGKVVKAFAAGGKKKGAELTVKTPSTYVAPYDSLFKGEGLLNEAATVMAG